MDFKKFRCYERAFLQQSTVDEGHKIATVDEGHKFAFKAGWDQTDYLLQDLAKISSNTCSRKKFGVHQMYMCDECVSSIIWFLMMPLIRLFRQKEPNMKVHTFHNIIIYS